MPFVSRTLKGRELGAIRVSRLFCFYFTKDKEIMKEKKTNPVVKLLQAVTDLLNREWKERAVTMSDIWRYVQDQLDVAKVVETGRVVDGVSSGFVIDVYVDSNSTYALVTKDDGKLYKIPVTVADDNSISTGNPIEVTMEFSPVTGRQIQVKRSADGKEIRWFATPAGIAAINRDGEIDSTKLFDSFIEYQERTNEYPELDFWHCGEQILLGKADWIARDGIAYCASGLFYDTPIARAAAKSIEDDKDYWGLSIAYIPTTQPEVIRSKDGTEIPVYNSGVNRYISLLPENAAASIMTSISTEKEVKRMNKKVEEALKKLTGDDLDLFEQTKAKLDGINREAENMVTRDATSKDESEDALTAKITAIIEGVLAKNTAAAPVVEQPVAQVAVTELETVDRNKELADVIKNAIEPLALQVAELSKTREAAVQEVLDDLPAKVVRQKIVRPRAAILPDAEAGKRYVGLANIAQEVVERMK